MAPSSWSAPACGGSSRSTARTCLSPRAGNQRSTYRSITVDGEEIEFTEGFTDLHTRVYERTLAGEGFDIAAARPSIELVHRIRHGAVQAAGGDRHPFLQEGVGL